MRRQARSPRLGHPPVVQHRDGAAVDRAFEQSEVDDVDAFHVGGKTSLSRAAGAPLRGGAPKVTGFLGAEGGKKPLPVPQAEVDRILGKADAAAERPRPKMQFEIGEKVKVTDGPFASFEGAVELDRRGHRPPEGDRFDFRPGHPGRSGIRPGRKDLTAGWSACTPQARGRLAAVPRIPRLEGSQGPEGRIRLVRETWRRNCWGA